MNFRSLTDSSTSESEDDANKNLRPGAPHIVDVGLSRSAKNRVTRNEMVACRVSSTSESEDDYAKRMHRPAPQPEVDNRLMKRKFCDEDSADEVPGRKKPTPYGNFMVPSSSADSELSGSESESPSPVKRSMPTFTGSSEIKTPEMLLKGGIGQKLMEKMGYIAGKGLGKYEQGRTEIVEASKQRGRRGLGLHLPKLEPSDEIWDFEQEKETVEEDIMWMPECLEDPPQESEMRGWRKIGKRKETIDDETHFCDLDVLNSVLTYKNVFDALESDEMRKARTRSNPFETIRGGIFLNRAAMKMANMDACFDFMFTQPVSRTGESLVKPGELLYFADVCAGPGGFSEYILWRKKWKAKGFGFTLKGPNDFKLEEFFAGPPETFEPYYGLNGVEGDGDIYLPDNLKAFQHFVFENTDDQGVHFVMADGGFSVEGRENIQEILSKRLYLCQFLCALMILRPGGHFVCKLFDIFTPFSVGLIYLMYRSFENVCIHKPNTSRPANSERYIICKWKKQNTDDVCDHFFKVNLFFETHPSTTSEDDVTEVVPLDVLKGDTEFYDYIVKSNNIIGARQAIHLDKIRVFAQNLDLHDKRQSDFRKQCLEYWKVPDKARSAPSKPEPEKKFLELMTGDRNIFESSHELLTMDNLGKLKNVFEFKAVLCGEDINSSGPGIFLGLGRSNIYRMELKTRKWLKIEGVSLELPANTLFYGELMHELKGEGRGQRKIVCVHVIDALYLGGEDVQKLHFEDRMALASKLAKAVSKPSRSDHTTLRVKTVWPLERIHSVLDKLAMKQVKNSGVPRLCYEMEDGRHFIPSGLLIFRTIADPWLIAYSRSNKKVYYFNTKVQQSATFERVAASAADFKTCFKRRIFWDWDKGVQLIPEQRVNCDAKKTVDGRTMCEFVNRHHKEMTGYTPR